MNKMQMLKMLILLAVVTFAPYTWADNSASWAKSYTLEAEKNMLKRFRHLMQFLQTTQTHN